MMDFEGKEELIRMVGENYRKEEIMAALMEQLQVMAQAYDQLAIQVGLPSNETANVQAMIQQVMAAEAGGGGIGTAVDMPEVGGESSITKKAREGAASVASPV